MSKASEWVRHLAAAKLDYEHLEREEVPRSFMPDGTGAPVVFVQENGQPYFANVRGTWSIEDALILAAWIQETFGEVRQK